MKNMYLRLIQFGFLALLLFLSGCNSSSSTDSPDNSLALVDDTSSSAEEVEVDSRILNSAASFLAAASGKENEINVDIVVFINSVLGLNNVSQVQKDLFSDLWIEVRDEYGIPVLDENGCEQPVANETIAIEDATTGEITYTNIVPVLDDCEIDPTYEDYTQEVELGRLNVVRSSIENPDVIARSLAEAINNINAADSIALDLAGRLVLTTAIEAVDEDTGELILDEETGEPTIVYEEHTIDSPLENIALYLALLNEGRIAGYGIESKGEEGEDIAAPWLEISDDVELGDLTYLRDGTDGRDGGIGLYNDYVDFSSVNYSSESTYHNNSIDFVQYNLYEEGTTETAQYYDDSADIWERVLDSESYTGTNIAGFTKLADDSRKIVVFMHNIIQDLPEEDVIASLPIVENYSDDGSQANDPRVLDSAASFLAAAASKEVPLTIDAVMFVNNVLGINQLDSDEPVDLYGELWVLARDENGIPELDENGCEQPVSSEELIVFDDEGNEAVDESGETITTSIVPMVLDEDGVCTVEAGYEEYVQEVELGRLSVVRTAVNNENMFYKQLIEAVNDLNSGESIKRDLGGRLIYSVLKENEDGTTYYNEENQTETTDYTIDSPVQNLALYWALMKWGKLEGTVNVKVEGEETDVAISLTADTDDSGLGYLKDGGVVNNNNGGGIDLDNGYANFSGYTHNSQDEYSEISVDYVQWHDSSAEGGDTYTDENDLIWERVLDSDEYDETDGSALEAFTKHADDARKVIVFIHEIIQDMPE